MIGKVLRGTRVQGLIRYLYGPGRNEEHRNPHLVAGYCDPAMLEPGLNSRGERDFRTLDGLLLQPVTLLGERNYRKPVWHLALRAAPEDPILTDEQWAAIAHEVMAQTGLAPRGDDEAVRWIAVRHADDHIHIVATLARIDGIRPDVHNDGYRVRDACRAVEARYGLRSTAPADRTPARRPTRGETEKANRLGRAEAARSTLRRQVTTAAAGARTEAEFFARLDAAGVLVRPRLSQQNPDQVTGYAVALSDDLTSAGEPVWFSGGKLAADLTLPKLRRRWSAPGPHPRPELADDRPHHLARDPLTAGSSGNYRPVSGKHLSTRTATAVLRTTVRQAADVSRTVDEFLSRLDQLGVLTRLRYSETNPGQVTGYAVTLPDHHTPSGQEAWYGGGRLADDLTLPRLQQRWARDVDEREPTRPDLTPQERQAIYDDAARIAANATAHIRRDLAINPYAARDACWAASDTLHVAAKTLGNPYLRRAADAYDRAARMPYGRIPKPTTAGDHLRTAARLMALAGIVGGRDALAALLLITNLTALIETIIQLYLAQRHEAQVAAARTCASHLRSAAGQASPSGTGPSPLTLAMTDFPVTWGPMPPASRTDSPESPSPWRPRPALNRQATPGR